MAYHIPCLQNLSLLHNAVSTTAIVCELVQLRYILLKKIVYYQ